jgi:molecular chaperone DnaK (HSP70)
MARYRIGIDLGTTNCALAAVGMDDLDGHSRILKIPQQETAHSSGSYETLPSFLYLPPDDAQGAWIAGRWARTRSGEVPGRVVSSAKSWMVHHAADRRASFLPLVSTDIPTSSLISPVQALSKLLTTMVCAWNAEHPDSPLANQEIAITVPASFDPAAQQLTLEAARDAGFPESTLLLEEPQAAFYAWMENRPEDFHQLNNNAKRSHVLVVDIGGGTTDLSLFEIDPRQGEIAPHLNRIAVSDHLLLGGDNLDLSLAHFLENRLSPETQLPIGTFAQLLARCREIKEEALGENSPNRSWPVAVARPGASLISGTLRTDVSSEEISQLLLEGFFPRVSAGERPLKASAGLREMGLPYAKDPAITRHLTDFLRDRPPIDYILFNGGLTKAPAIRNRVLENLTQWQIGHAPTILENHEPDLAVARGASRFLYLRDLGDSSRIESGASHSYYVGLGDNKALCVLPHGAAPEKSYSTDVPGLRAIVGKPAKFALHRHARRISDSSGDIVILDDSGFSELPSVETILKPQGNAKTPEDPNVRVNIRTTLRSTGLLRIELRSIEASSNFTWPLEFQLRGQRRSTQSSFKSESPQSASAMTALLDGTRRTSQKLTANAVFQVGEKSIGSPKANWSGGIVRFLFDQWLEIAPHRSTSAEHEETWLQVAGYLLRPGCGMAGDEERVDALQSILCEPSKWNNGAVKIQRWICARRIASGLNATQALAIWNLAKKEWRNGSVPSAEIALLAGSLESLPSDIRRNVALEISEAILKNPKNTALWKSLGRLLSRILFHSGAEQVLPPDFVGDIWEKLKDLEIEESIRPEASAAWLRAARLTGLRPLDVPKGIRNQINAELRRWGITDVRRRILEEVVPIFTSDQTGLLGESPPPGLSLD